MVQEVKPHGSDSSHSDSPIPGRLAHPGSEQKDLLPRYLVPPYPLSGVRLQKQEVDAQQLFSFIGHQYDLEKGLDWGFGPTPTPTATWGQIFSYTSNIGWSSLLGDFTARGL